MADSDSMQFAKWLGGPATGFIVGIVLWFLLKEPLDPDKFNSTDVVWGITNAAKFVTIVTGTFALSSWAILGAIWLANSGKTDG